MNVKPSDTSRSPQPQPQSSPLLRRRRLVAAGSVTLAGSLAAAWWAAQAQAHSPAVVGGSGSGPDRDALRAWIDTLLPAEGASPGALATGVDRRITTAAAGNPTYSRLLAAGLAWAEGEARRAGAASFAALGSPGREAIVARAEAAAAASTARTFFQATLDDVHYHHWADPRTWAELGYAGPPQPAGFMDHDKAPRR